MRFLRTLPIALAAAALTACGGGEPAEMAETEAAPEAAAAPAETMPESACFLQGATLEEAKARPSPLMATTFSVGGNDGTLCYGAPSANGRQVMGALVPFGEPWRMGANEATAIHLTGPASVGGVALEPGSYSLYAVPGESEWTIHLNSNYQRWGIPINADVQGADVGSFTVTPEATEAPVEQLTFRYELWDDGTMGDMVMEWENTRIRFHVHPAM